MYTLFSVTLSLFIYFYLKQLQALHQIQALNGLSPATTLVNGVSNNTVSYQSVAPSQQFHPAVSVASNYAAANPAAVAQTTGQIGSTANPYQGVGLSSATTATAQPSSAVSLLALQQLLASNGVNSMGSPAAQLAYTNGAQGKLITFYYNVFNIKAATAVPLPPNHPWPLASWPCNNF